MQLGRLELHSDEQLLAVQLKSAMSPPAAVVEKRYTMVFPAAGAMASRDSPEKGYAVKRLTLGSRQLLCPRQLAYSYRPFR